LNSDGEVTVGYRFTPKLSIGGTAIYREDSFGDVASSSLGTRSLIDQRTYGWGATAIYEHSPSSHFWTRAITGVSEVDSNEDRDFFEAVLGLRKQFTSKLSLEASAGIDHRSGGLSEDTTNPIGAAELVFRSNLGDVISLGVTQEFGASTFQEDADVSTTRFSAKAKKTFDQHATIGIEGGYSLFSYEGGTTQLADETFLSISPTLDYRFTDRFSAGLFYIYGNKEAGTELLSYTEKRAGLNANVNF
jgi:hypothetical protein